MGCRRFVWEQQFISTSMDMNRTQLAEKFRFGSVQNGLLSRSHASLESGKVDPSRPIIWKFGQYHVTFQIFCLWIFTWNIIWVSHCPDKCRHSDVYHFLLVTTSDICVPACVLSVGQSVNIIEQIIGDEKSRFRRSKFHENGMLCLICVTGLNGEHRYGEIFRHWRSKSVFAVVFGRIPVFEGITIAKCLKNRSSRKRRKIALNFRVASIDNGLGNWATNVEKTKSVHFELPSSSLTVFVRPRWAPHLWRNFEFRISNFEFLECYRAKFACEYLENLRQTDISPLHDRLIFGLAKAWWLGD
jgi:hypothetical protein